MDCELRIVHCGLRSVLSKKEGGLECVSRVCPVWSRLRLRKVKVSVCIVRKRVYITFCPCESWNHSGRIWIPFYIPPEWYNQFGRPLCQNWFLWNSRNCPDSGRNQWRTIKTSFSPGFQSSKYILYNLFLTLAEPNPTYKAGYNKQWNAPAFTSDQTCILTLTWLSG